MAAKSKLQASAMRIDSTSVAATTAALLFDAGVVPKEARGGVFVVEARNLHCDQYSNDNNWLSHFETTAPEILAQTGGRLTHFVAGIGTGGTVKDRRIEIQGDQRERIIVELENLGYQVKRVGG